ncbi:hypothetical protein IMPR6_700025 [Imperialibacter sp. EC-SDR9]|nr:hypothetical protein IMPERIA89_340431 [Imperialibacter sp. 89]CAD5298296.1 hypothetical protein IMPERIA75_700430 [Imperialibacter sp. 75]VVT34855.1 hypothetical protein IMPR6_700025 [Imperialibacter sp. EC-SDR9]
MNHINQNLSVINIGPAIGPAFQKDHKDKLNNPQKVAQLLAPGQNKKGDLVAAFSVK